MSVLEISNHLPRPVGGMTVGNGDVHLCVGMGLRKNGIQQEADALFFIVAWDDNGNRRRHSGNAYAVRDYFLRRAMVEASGLTSGSLTINSLPWPTLLRTLILPPCA